MSKPDKVILFVIVVTALLIAKIFGILGFVFAAVAIGLYDWKMSVTHLADKSGET